MGLRKGKSVHDRHALVALMKTFVITKVENRPAIFASKILRGRRAQRARRGQSPLLI
jgi:hypothetical protein